MFELFYGTRHPPKVYFALLVLTLGVMLVVAVNVKFHIIGMACALGSTIIFVVQNIFSKRIFAHYKKTATKRVGLDKINLILYSSTFSFVLMSPLWAVSDGKMWFNNEIRIDSRLAMLFLFNGFAHFLQALLAFSMLSIVSPVTYSIASLFKRVFVITASILYFNDDVKLTQVTGLLITFVGLYMYQNAEADVEKAEKAVFRDEKPLLG